jgi:hypothetical protein
LDYYTSGGTAGCPALLVEPSAQNFARGVERLNTPIPATAAGGITVTTGSTDFLAPDGASGTITKYVGGTASGSNFLEYISSTSVTASGVHTFSAFVKAGATNPLNFCALQFTAFTAASGTGTSYFSLASGTALTAGASIQDYGNGWYRIISAPYTIASGDLTGSIRLLFAEGDNDASFPASGALNLTLYAWGIQLEAGSIATSYIPTTTGSVTRNADVVTLSGAVSGCIGQTEGTIYAEVDVQFNNRNADIIGLDSGSSANGFYLVIRSSSVIELRIRQNSTNALIFQRTGAYPVGINKIAVSYKNGDFAISLNGTTTQVDTTTITMPSVAITRASVVPSINFTLDQSIRVRSAALYTTRLTNSELAALTT